MGASRTLLRKLKNRPEHKRIKKGTRNYRRRLMWSSAAFALEAFLHPTKGWRIRRPGAIH
jgi:hypothetical protein